MNILILSRNRHLYSSKRLIEESLIKGHNTAIVDYMHCNIITEKNNPVVHFNGNVLKDIDFIIPRIGATFTFYGSTIIRQFEMLKIKSLISSQALLIARDKLQCLQKLTQVSVGMPKTYFTHYYHNIDEIITTVGGFPFIIKQLEGTQGHGVFLVKDHKHATEIIKIHESANIKFLIQEYIAESKGADIRVIVIGNKVVAAMKRQAKNGEFRSNLHQGGKGHKIILSEKEMTTAIKATQAMGLSVAGVDMLQSERGPLVIEVNASPGLEGIEKTTKINIAEKVFEYIEKTV